MAISWVSKLALKKKEEKKKKRDQNNLCVSKDHITVGLKYGGGRSHQASCERK